MKTLFEQDLKVVNVGLHGFAANITAAGGSVTHLSWSPPAGADAALGWTVANMIGDPRIDEANRAAYERYLAAQPRLVDFLLARDAIPVLAERRSGHIPTIHHTTGRRPNISQPVSSRPVSPSVPAMLSDDGRQAVIGVATSIGTKTTSR